MTKDEYTKRLEEIMLKPAHWQYDDWLKAKQSLLQLNNEAIGADESEIVDDLEEDNSFNYDHTNMARNEFRQELRNILGASNEQS